MKTGIFEAEMGRSLNKSFEKRLVGDYSFVPEVTKEDAEETLNWAREFVKEVESYLLRSKNLG